MENKSAHLKKHIESLMEAELKPLILQIKPKKQVKTEQDYHPNPLATSGSRDGFAGMAVFPNPTDYDKFGNLLDDILI